MATDEFCTEILSLTKTEPSDFVGFWTRGYRDPTDDRKYRDNILQAQDAADYDIGRVTELMEWKAGRFKDNARRFAARVDLDRLNGFRSEPLTEESLPEFWYDHASGLAASKESIIWPIFVCHMGHPEAVPIYDVNVWHAWLYLTGKLTAERLEQNPRRFDEYLSYRRFFQEFLAVAGVESRALDKALMAFGQFLTSPAAKDLGLGLPRSR